MTDEEMCAQLRVCSECKGRGRIIEHSRLPESTCDRCGGSGQGPYPQAANRIEELRGENEKLREAQARALREAAGVVVALLWAAEEE